MKHFTLVFLAMMGHLLAADDDGFVPLFNGRDLTGWVNANCAPETWSVRDEVIHCTGKPIGALRTERQYENFILEAEWRHLTSGGNSGIFIWGTPIAAPGVPFLRGIEVQVLDHGYAEQYEKHHARRRVSHPRRHDETFWSQQWHEEFPIRGTQQTVARVESLSHRLLEWRHPAQCEWPGSLGRRGLQLSQGLSRP
jgi:hypothetical protein